jgi:UDP-glucuronate 4-epimerase
MRIVVTGAAGFIGSHLSAELAKNSNNEIYAIDNLNDYYSPELKNERVKRFLTTSNIKFNVVDFSDKKLFQNFIKEIKPKSIYHLGAQAGIRLPLEKYDVYVKNNLVGFSNVLNTAIENQVPNFVYASSSSVYGDSASVPLNEGELNLNPTSFYGSTKLSNELVARTLANKFDIRIRGLRFFTVYGPWGRPDMAYFRIIEALLNNENFRLYGDGTISRDFTFIDDVVRSCILLEEELSQKNTSYHDVVNIGGGRPQSMIELIRSMEKITSSKLNSTIHQANSSDVQITHADNSYLNSLIGEQSFTQLENGLESIFTWAQQEDVLPKLRSWVASSI